MFVFNRLARGAAAYAVLSLVAVGAPQIAAAQPTPDYPITQDDRDAQGGDSRYDEARSSYEACKSQKTNRAVTGAVVGGLLGAVVGSQVSGHGERTEGSLIGGGGGAIAGAAIGSSSTNCDNPPAPPRADYRPANDGPGYGEGDRDYGDHDAGPSDGRDYAQGGPPPPQADGCDWADSTVYMPDGTRQKQLVHVCRDLSGRYRVVQ